MEEESKKISAAKICLDSYEKLAFYNLKHIKVQKIFLNIFVNGKKLGKLKKGSEEYKELKEKIERFFHSLSEDAKVVEYLESMRVHCNPDDSHLLEKLNVEEVEAFSKKEEAQAEHHKPA